MKLILYTYRLRIVQSRTKIVYSTVYAIISKNLSSRQTAPPISQGQKSYSLPQCNRWKVTNSADDFWYLLDILTLCVIPGLGGTHGHVSFTFLSVAREVRSQVPHTPNGEIGLKHYSTQVYVKEEGRGLKGRKKI